MVWQHVWQFYFTQWHYTIQGGKGGNEETRVICGFLGSFEIVLFGAVNPPVVPAGLETTVFA